MEIELPGRSEVEAAVMRWHAASADLADLLGRYGELAPALRHFALQLRLAQRPIRAVEAFRCALALDPDDAGAWRDLASAHEAAGDDAQARAAIGRAIAMDPSDPHTWFTAAAIERRAGDRDAAAAAYRRAIAIDPSMADAHLGLGLLHFEERHFDDAVDRFEAAVALAPGNGLAQGCLGQALYATGAFGAAAAAFDIAARHDALDAAGRQVFAYARMLHSMIEGHVQAGLDAYVELAGPGAEPVEEVSRAAFKILSLFGHTSAALEVGRLRLARGPGDAVQRYMLDAVGGRQLDRAPVDYLEQHFDAFASSFDQRLVEMLGYHVPERLAGMVGRHRQRCSDILDLGCGTGLAAEQLARFGGRLSGLDLSAKMLDEARQRGRYTSLLKGEAVETLRSASARYDLVFAADLLIYIGEIRPLFGAVAGCLVPGGVFAFSIETAESGAFVLLPSGRFAHDPRYIARCAEPGFDVVESGETIIRLEGRHPVDGMLFVLRRR